MKSFCVHRDLADSDVCSPKLVTAIVRLAKDSKPLLDFGWALD